MSDTKLAILYLGEMGATWARLLKPRGISLITATGRSKDTEARAREIGVELLPSLEEVAKQADIIVSLVVPAAAAELGSEVARAIKAVRTNPIFVECNATSPDTAEKIALLIQQAGGRYVDGCVIGPAMRLSTGTSLAYLSGPAAQEVAMVLEGSIPYRVLGEGISTVSSFKMSYAAFNRGCGSMIVEALILAERQGVLSEMLDFLYERYPDLMWQMDYYIPGLPRQAVRRVGEMLEVAGTEESVGMAATMVPPAVSILKAIAQAKLEGVDPSLSDRGKTTETIRLLSSANVISLSSLEKVR